MPAPFPLFRRGVTGSVKVSPSGGLRPTLTDPPSLQARVGYASRQLPMTVRRREPPHIVPCRRMP
jgi:hypothetical protein